MKYEQLFRGKERCWLETGANNNEVLGSVHLCATDLRARLDDPCGLFPTQNIL